MVSLTGRERHILEEIVHQTTVCNIDNISRTIAYQRFYIAMPEIKWAFLASMVSRNAGWNMTDLQTPVFISLLHNRMRRHLFSTYEWANWLIFSDAFPQLLIYQKSKQQNDPLFRLLPFLSVSSFMEKEWNYFWKYQDHDRLMTALIINEQNIIQTPVIKHPYYKHFVYHRLPYLLQDFFLLNAVLFPSRSGAIIANYVHDFSSLTKRIMLGKRLAKQLFHPSYYRAIYDFAIHTEHTGSRKDYEQYTDRITPGMTAPALRQLYSVVHHEDSVRKDWFVHNGVKEKWNDDVSFSSARSTLEHFYKKRKLLYKIYILKQRCSPIKNKPLP